MRRGATLAALLALGGCSSPPKQAVEPPDVCNPHGFTVPLRLPGAYEGLGPPLAAVNGPTQVGAFGSYFACDGGNVLPAAVTAEVVGPSNQPVDAQLSTGPTAPDDLLVQSSLLFPFGFDFSNAQVTEADVAFTPPERGWYHVVVHFQPSLGLAQTDVRALAVRVDAGYQTLPMPILCSGFDLRQGVGLCSVSGRLYTVLDGGLVDQAEGYAFAADDTGVWAIDATDGGAQSFEPYVARYALSADGHLTQVASRSLAGQPVGLADPSFANSSVLGREGRALIVSPPHVAEAWLADGGIELGADQDIGVGPGAQLQWRPGVGVVVYGADPALGPEVCSVPFGGVPDCGMAMNGMSDGEWLWGQSLAGEWFTYRMGSQGVTEVVDSTLGPDFSFNAWSFQGLSPPHLYYDSPVGLVLPSATPGTPLIAYGPRPTASLYVSNGGGDARLYWEQAASSPLVMYVWR